MALRPKIPLYQYRGHARTDGPDIEPLTADELRTHLRESIPSLPDGDAEAFIAEAREYIEEMTGLALITQSWIMAIDRWPGGREPWWDGTRQGAIMELHGARSYTDLRLPRYPLQSVDTVTVYDEDSNATSVTVSDVFDIDTYQKPGRMTLKTGATWPVALREQNAIEINYTAGYGAVATDVPASLRAGVKRMAAHLYTYRGDCGCEEAAGKTGVDKLVAAFSARGI